MQTATSHTLVIPLILSRVCVCVCVCVCVICASFWQGGVFSQNDAVSRGGEGLQCSTLAWCLEFRCRQSPEGSSHVSVLNTISPELVRRIKSGEGTSTREPGVLEAKT